MKIILSIDKFYAYEHAPGVPSAADLASGEAAKLAPGVFGRRVLREAPGGLNDRGEPAQLITDFRPEFFDQLGDKRDLVEARAALIGGHFAERILPWNAPVTAITRVEVDGDAELATALGAFLGVKEG